MLVVERCYAFRSLPKPLLVWCERRDSNPQALRRSDLNRVRLPIPPRSPNSSPNASGQPTLSFTRTVGSIDFPCAASISARTGRLKGGHGKRAHSRREKRCLTRETAPRSTRKCDLAGDPARRPAANWPPVAALAWSKQDKCESRDDWKCGQKHGVIAIKPLERIGKSADDCQCDYSKAHDCRPLSYGPFDLARGRKRVTWR